MPTGQTGVGIFLLKLSFQMILGWILKLAKDYILGLVSLGAWFHESLRWAVCLVFLVSTVYISFPKVLQSSHSRTYRVLFCFVFYLLCFWKSLFLDFWNPSYFFCRRLSVPLSFLEVSLLVFSLSRHAAPGTGKCPEVTESYNLFIKNGMSQHSWNQCTRSSLFI